MTERMITEAHWGYYAFPLAKGWIAKQRMRPSLHVAKGTEGHKLWVPSRAGA